MAELLPARLGRGRGSGGLLRLGSEAQAPSLQPPKAPSSILVPVKAHSWLV